MLNQGGHHLHGEAGGTPTLDECRPNRLVVPRSFGGQSKPLPAPRLRGIGSVGRQSLTLATTCPYTEGDRAGERRRRARVRDERSSELFERARFLACPATKRIRTPVLSHRPVSDGQLEGVVPRSVGEGLAACDGVELGVGVWGESGRDDGQPGIDLTFGAISGEEESDRDGRGRAGGFVCPGQPDRARHIDAAHHAGPSARSSCSLVADIKLFASNTHVRDVEVVPSQL